MMLNFEKNIGGIIQCCLEKYADNFGFVEALANPAVNGCPPSPRCPFFLI
jgi:hypothetical protein